MKIDKTYLQKAVCALLVLVLLPQVITVAASPFWHIQMPASPTVRHGEMAWQSPGGLQAAQYLHITPGADVRPITWAGGTVFGASNINTMISRASDAGHNVLGGINADFFAFATGVSEGIYLSNGRLKSSHHGRSAVFFNEDGSGFALNPSLSIRLQNLTNPGAGAVQVPFFNKTRHSAWPVLYDHYFSNTTRTQTPGREVLFRVINGTPRIGGAMMLEVVQLSNAGGQTPLTAGYMTLSFDLRSPYLDQVDRFSPGDQVRLEITGNDPRLQEALWGVGGGDILVAGGQITSGWDTGIGGRHPRTAIGFARDGSVIFYTADGRQPGRAVGLTLQELAQEMISLGAYYVVNLDGGGSTSFSYRVPGSNTATVQNRPSDGSLRGVSNTILLTGIYPQSGVARHMQFHLVYRQVLAGALVPLTEISHITMTDAGYFPVSANHVSFESISPNNPNLGTGAGQNFQAGQSTASGWLNVVAANGARGKMEIVVVDRPEEIVVSHGGNRVTSLTLAQNAQTNLHFSAWANGQAIFAPANMWNLTVSENIGTIDQSGNLRITGQAGSRGEILIGVGGTQAQIAINIAEHFIDIEGHWAIGYIREMREMGVVSGVETSNGLAFFPNQSLSRAEFSAMLSRLLQIDTGQYTLSSGHFIDDGDIPLWARPYIGAMVARGYLTGRGTFEGLRFDPNAPITRAEAFTVLGRLLNTNVSTDILNQFVDGDTIPPWGRQEIARLVAAGMLQGTDEGRLNPLNNLHRGEGAAILARQSRAGIVSMWAEGPLEEIKEEALPYEGEETQETIEETINE